MNAADLASLLGSWGGPTTSCVDIAPEQPNGFVDAADLAFLLSQWNDVQQGAMAQPSDMAFDDTTIFKDGAGANQPNQNVTATVPWVIAHFGFDSVSSYTGWLDLLTEDELFDHIAAMLNLITGN